MGWFDLIQCACAHDISYGLSREAELLPRRFSFIIIISSFIELVDKMQQGTHGYYKLNRIKVSLLQRKSCVHNKSVNMSCSYWQTKWSGNIWRWKVRWVGVGNLEVVWLPLIKVLVLASRASEVRVHVIFVTLSANLHIATAQHRAYALLSGLLLWNNLCIVLYLYIYIALLAVHTNEKRFQCERPREKRAVLRERKEALGSPVNKL